MICESHGRPKVTTCNWCSKPICEECIDAAQGKKYCEDCYKKLKPEEVQRRTSHLTENMGPIRNVDPTLTEGFIKEQRDKFVRKTNPQKSKIRIRNVP